MKRASQFPPALSKRALVLDCLECAGGVYVGTASARPHCDRCGGPAPDSVVDVLRAHDARASRAA